MKTINDVPSDAGDWRRKIAPHPAMCTWVAMFGRVNKQSGPYIGCSVCDEWHTYSVFKAWYISHPHWDTWELDKDLLLPGNKVYGPDYCCLIPRQINAFIRVFNTKYKTGASFANARAHLDTPWAASISEYNILTGKTVRKYLGYFLTEDDAHMAWKNRKYELACMFSDMYQLSDNIAEALKTRYL